MSLSKREFLQVLSCAAAAGLPIAQHAEAATDKAEEQL